VAITQLTAQAAAPIRAPGSQSATFPAQREPFMAQTTTRTARTTNRAHESTVRTTEAPSFPAADSEARSDRDESAGPAERGAPIPQSAMQDASYTRNWWRVVFDAERTPYQSMLTDIAVWGPNEAKLRAGDLIEVLDEQSTIFAVLYLVEHVPAKFVRFAELIKIPLGGVAIGTIEARGHHYAQWRGPAKRWCVVGPTGTVVRDGILTKEEAERDVTTRNMSTSLAFVSHPRM
jgi:hypothetical protein